MRTALVPLNAAGAMPLSGEEMFERHKQVRTQTSLLAPDRVQISVFEQARKKFLDQILRFFSSKTVSPDKSVKRSPISATENFECSLCSGRFALRLQHYAPVSGGECHSTTIGALDCGRSVHKLMLHAFVAFFLRTTASAFCPKKRKKNKQFHAKNEKHAPARNEVSFPVARFLLSSKRK